LAPHLITPPTGLTTTSRSPVCPV